MQPVYEGEEEMEVMEVEMEVEMETAMEMEVEMEAILGVIFSAAILLMMRKKMKPTVDA